MAVVVEMINRVDVVALAQHLVHAKITTSVTVGNAARGRYRLLSGQILVTDGTMDHTNPNCAPDDATFAMIIEHDADAKYWNIVQIDFAYTAKVRLKRLEEEIRLHPAAHGYRPDEITAMLWGD